MPTRATTEIKKRRYRVLYRSATTVSTPANLTAMDTLVSGFTELGYCEDKSIQLNIVKGDEVVLDTSAKKTVGWNGNFEAKVIQSDPADQATIEGLEGGSYDVMLLPASYASGDAGTCYIIKACVPFVENNVVSGEVENLMFKAEYDNVAARSDILLRFDIPTS